jgi:hypothetical protein
MSASFPEEVVAAFLARVGSGEIDDVRRILAAAPGLVNAVGPHPFWGRLRSGAAARGDRCPHDGQRSFPDDASTIFLMPSSIIVQFFSDSWRASSVSLWFCVRVRFVAGPASASSMVTVW